jgi:protein-disulfide isomerase
MFKTLISATVSATILATAVPAPSLAQAPAARSAAAWSKVVTATADGGYMMGNPKAAVHIIEYASYTCPACRQFNATEKPKLIAKYIDTGKVKFEFRSFLLHGAPDYMASMMTSCLPVSRFFSWSDIVFNEAGDWTSGFKNVTQADQKAVESMKPQDALTFLADKGGFDDFWRKKGIPKATYDKCMANTANFDKHASVYKQGNAKFNITGTPTFIINGKKADGAISFADLDAQLKKIVK